MANPRNAGRKPSGKIKHNLSIYLDPEVSAILKSKKSQAAWIAALVEEYFSTQARPQKHSKINPTT
jgi:hypothetical protein